jgi:hypothetical protein
MNDHISPDHYMFTRGGFGEHKNLNFFVDSGLVALDTSTGNGTSGLLHNDSEKHKEWGVEDAAVSKSLFECGLPISLGPLQQNDQYFTTT